GLDRCFFCNSGAEANEAAIKLARKYAKENLGEGKNEIITMRSSFHGRTMATLTATGQEKIQKGFDPLLPGFKYVEYNNLEALKVAVTEKTCAVMLEPVQGEGGVVIPADGYLKSVRELCDSKNILLILDEVQSGMGRTGKFFAYEHAGIKPDITTLAKALGGGLPLGVMLSSEKLAKAFSAGTHGSTFGGGPIVCAASLAVLNFMLKNNVLKNVNEMGAYFLLELNKLKAKHKIIKEARGLGLFCGLELTIPGKELVKKMLERGVLINCTNETVLRFLPPLIISRKHIKIVIKELDAALFEAQALPAE
ncbi:MAG: acetylornithine transaminase, partial [Candidatus Firestonebacteria bacterium]